MRSNNSFELCQLDLSIEIRLLLVAFAVNVDAEGGVTYNSFLKIIKQLESLEIFSIIRVTTTLFCFFGVL